MKTNEKLENKENNSNLSNAEGRAGEFGEPETLGDSATQTARDAIATRGENVARDASETQIGVNKTQSEMRDANETQCAPATLEKVDAQKKSKAPTDKDMANEQNAEKIQSATIAPNVQDAQSMTNAQKTQNTAGDQDTAGAQNTKKTQTATIVQNTERAQNTAGDKDTAGASSTETRDANATLNKDKKNNKIEKKREKDEKKREKSVQNAQNGAQKRANWFVRLWKYYSPYEKIWLISICTVGVLLGIFFPEDASQPSWLRIVEIIVIIGGCSCELLLSKQSRWAFVVSFFLYDTTQTIVYFANGLYISALFELIFWIPILWISFYQWTKQADAQNHSLTAVKKVNYARDLAIFVGVLIVSVVTGILFTTIGALAENMPDWWYLDALANTFSVCNGLFLVFRFREQWLPWIGVAVVEAIMWILSGQYIMLVLSLGYLMNSLYGLIKWQQYIKTHPAQNSAKAQNIQNNQTK